MTEKFLLFGELEEMGLIDDEYLDGDDFEGDDMEELEYDEEEY